MDHPPLTSPVVTQAHCTHLRHKGMYVTSAPEDQEFVANSATAYWCLETMKSLGPDGKPVHPDSCQGGRECCRH